jgi:hypothetical protein
VGLRERIIVVVLVAVLWRVRVVGRWWSGRGSIVGEDGRMRGWMAVVVVGWFEGSGLVRRLELRYEGRPRSSALSSGVLRRGSAEWASLCRSIAGVWLRALTRLLVRGFVWASGQDIGQGVAGTISGVLDDGFVVGAAAVGLQCDVNRH